MIFIFTCALTACSFDSLYKERVCFKMPDLNDCDASKWNVMWVQEGTLNTFCAGGKSFELSLVKNSAAAVIVYPASDAAFKKVNVALKDFLLDKNCYGAIYPFCTKLNKNDSFVADVFFSVSLCAAEQKERVQDFVNSFNWSRLCKECAAYEDPWLLDKERIVKAIAEGNFKKTNIKLR